MQHTRTQQDIYWDWRSCRAKGEGLSDRELLQKYADEIDRECAHLLDRAERLARRAAWARRRLELTPPSASTENEEKSK